MGWLDKRRARKEAQLRKQAWEAVAGQQVTDDEWVVMEQENVWWKQVQNVGRHGFEPEARHLDEFPTATHYRIVITSVTGESETEPGAWPATSDGYAQAKSRAMHSVLLRSALNRSGGGSGYVWLTDQYGEWLGWIFCVGLGTSGMHISGESRDIAQVDTDEANELGGLFFLARSTPGLAQRYGFH